MGIDNSDAESRLTSSSYFEEKTNDEERKSKLKLNKAPVIKKAKLLPNSGNFLNLIIH